VPSWIEGHRARCGPLTDAASIFSASLGVERDPPSGARGLLAVARAIEQHLREPDPGEEQERLFVELAGAYFGVLLCDALGHARHTTRDGRHGLELGARTFFDPFAAIELTLAADDVRACLAEQVALAETSAEQDPHAGSSPRWEHARPRLLPRLVGQKFFASVQERAASMPLCAYAIAADVHVCFVLREPGRARYVRSDEATRWKQSRAQLLRAALNNLARQSKRARMHCVDGAEGSLVMASSGDGLDSSRLLLPGLHDVLAPALGSPFVAAIPHRDALYACPLGSPDALRALRARAHDEAARAPHAITAELLLVEPGGRLSALADR
jgi:hypothetical protein